MTSSTRSSRIFLIAALAMLTLRALTPEGYMPGTRDSGLLYELCPSAVSPELVRFLAGDSHHHHHHHHGQGDPDAASAASSSQCPIGHMLASAVAADIATWNEILPDTPVFADAPAQPRLGARAAAYRSRAPPA